MNYEFDSFDPKEIYRAIIIAISPVAIALTICFQTMSPRGVAYMREFIYPISASGVVVEKQIQDEYRVYNRILMLESGDSLQAFITDEWPDLWDAVSVGDSIYKIPCESVVLFASQTGTRKTFHFSGSSGTSILPRFREKRSCTD